MIGETKPTAQYRARHREGAMVRRFCRVAPVWVYFCKEESGSGRWLSHRRRLGRGSEPKRPGLIAPTSRDHHRLSSPLQVETLLHRLALGPRFSRQPDDKIGEHLRERRLGRSLI